MRELKRFPYHPILAVVYPVVALLAHNIAQVEVGDALRSLVAVVLAAVLIFGLLRLLLKDWERAGIVSTILLALFFSYGQIYAFFEQRDIFGVNMGRHRVLIPIWIGLACIGLWWSLRRLRNLPSATQTFNVIVSLALLLPLVQLGWFGFQSSAAWSQPPWYADKLDNLQLVGDRPLPDIYLIVLDAYTREDVLDQVFDFENGPFIQKLEDLGFYVAGCSQSNYAQTELALGSMLNINYLEDLGVLIDPQSSDRSPLWPLVTRSAVRKGLSDLGYTFVAFDSGFYRTQITDADVYLSNQAEAIGGVNGFEVMLVKTTAGLLLTDAASALPRFLTTDIEEMEYRQRREVILYTLGKLPKIQTEIQGPKFVFAHIMAPHEPYLFGPDGEPVTPPDRMEVEDHLQGYPDQVSFLNSRLIPLLEEIIANAETPPVIVLQGDHGAGWSSDQGRMAILNAYYLAGQDFSGLYAGISPVNSFRVIFNRFFGAGFELLDDESYFSVYEKPYNFKLIPNSVCK